jgi:plastocyanin
MKRTIAFLAVLGAAAAFSPTAVASAADATIRPAGTDTEPVWSPAAVSVDVGDTVTWSFTGSTIAHNVTSNSANWTFSSPTGVGQAPAAFTFTAAGTYAFVCSIHPDTMRGTVTVGNAPPPPPPPPSQQWLPNDQSPPTVLEVTDDTRPRLSRVRVHAIARGARVRVRVNEPGRVTIRARRGHHVVRSRTVTLRRAATRTVALHGLRAGAYRIEMRARDLAGNRSRVRRAHVTVRG